MSHDSLAELRLIRGDQGTAFCEILGFYKSQVVNRILEYFIDRNTASSYILHVYLGRKMSMASSDLDRPKLFIGSVPLLKSSNIIGN